VFFFYLFLSYLISNYALCLRFISLLDLEGTSKLEDFVLLALAADEFLMEPLRDLCRFEIEKLVTVKNVWLTLNSICLVPKIAAACTKVIILFCIKLIIILRQH